MLRLQAQPPRLAEVSSFSNAFEPRYLATLGESWSRDRLVVGDGMRSIIVLEISEGSGESFNSSRDMSAHSVRALGTMSDTEHDVVISDVSAHLIRTLLTSKVNANLLTFRAGTNGIEAGATFGLREDVTRLRRGSLVPMSPAPDIVQSHLLFATANGRLGVVGKLGKSATRTLQDLQRNMNKTLKGPGNLEWKMFRRGGTSVVPKETAGFVDGDL